MLGEDTSNTPPSQYVPSLNSVSKLFRKLNTGAAELITTPERSSTLSLITAVSATNALLSVSGSPVEVTQVGGGPTTMVCVHPGGNAGGVTPSKFSVQAAGLGVGVAGGGVGVAGGADGVGVGTPGVGVGEGTGVIPGVGEGPHPPLPSPRS